MPRISVPRLMSSRPKVKSIRALARGLQVLQLVQSAGGMSLNDIHRETGLAKATLLRVIVTLMDEGLVWQRIVDNAYLASVSLQANARHLDDDAHLVEVASPVLGQLTRDVDWPSILAVPRLNHMEVIEANSPRSYFHHIPLGPIGFQINMLLSATGRAYLAFCSDTERQAILTRLQHSPRAGDHLAQSPARVAAIMLETRRQGFGSRDASFGGDFDRPRREHDDGRDSIAVPIVAAGRVRGIINLTWIQKVAARERIVEAHLGRLKAAAETIGARLSESARR